METKNLQCLDCKHYNAIGGGCKAFPEGIPDSFLMGKKHNKVLKNQIGEYIFEK